MAVRKAAELAERREAAPPAASPLSRTRTALETLGLVVAPASLLTGLLFYFGWSRTRTQAAFFGIDSSVLGFSNQDYVLRSIGAVFWTLVAILVAGLAAVVLHSFAATWIARESLWELRLAAIVTGAAGLAALLLGIASVWWPPDLWSGLVVKPAAFAVGVALAGYAAYLGLSWWRLERDGGPDPSRRLATVGGTLVSFLVVLFLFWAVGDYAALRGNRLARQMAENLNRLPSVSVYSSRRLHVDAAGVEEAALAGEEGGFRFRYTGLKLLVRSEGKLFLLPETWTRREGVAVVLPDSEDFRFEFAPGRSG